MVNHPLGSNGKVVNTVPCPSCSSPGTVSQGSFPEFRSHRFGGVPASIAFSAGILYRCSTCDLRFRRSALSQEVLTQLYEKLPSDVWKSDRPRHYWPRALKLMERYSPNRTVLDVGCFRGDFLAWLPNQWNRLGVEPVRSARLVAQERGIPLSGRVLGEVRSLPEPPGAIILFDLLEHLVNPLEGLGQAKDLLVGEGVIIALTGSANTLPFRLFGSDYWYCALPEHVSFLTLRWFHWAAGQLGLSVVWFEYLASEPGGLLQSGWNFARLSAYSALQRMRRNGVPERWFSHLPFFRQVAFWESPPWWQQAKDHILIALQRHG